MADVFFVEEVSNEEVNPYEAVRAASIEARRINQLRSQMEVRAEGEKATTLGLRRLSEKQIAVKYEVPDTDQNDASGEGS